MLKRKELLCSGSASGDQPQGTKRAQTQILADFCQRTPWGGGKKRGVENLTNDTPPKKGFWTPLRTVRFPPPSGVSALFFLQKNPRQSRPEALLEGSKNFRESAFFGTFSSPHTFCTPPYHGPSLPILTFYLENKAFGKCRMSQKPQIRVCPLKRGPICQTSLGQLGKLCRREWHLPFEKRENGHGTQVRARETRNSGRTISQKRSLLGLDSLCTSRAHSGGCPRSKASGRRGGQASEPRKQAQQVDLQDCISPIDLSRMNSFSSCIADFINKLLGNDLTKPLDSVI